MNTTLTQCDSTNCHDQHSENPRQTVRPLADIYEAGDAWFLVLEMPGVDEQGTDVACEQKVLTVVGTAEVFDTEGFDHRFGQLAARRYERTFRLPEEVDVAGIEAHVKNGVLRLRLPKAATALPQKIAVQAG